MSLDPTPAPPAIPVDPEDESNPGLVLARLIADRVIVPVSDAAMEAHRAEEHTYLVRALRKEAGCPDRAARFLRDHEGDWFLKNEKLRAYRVRLLEKLAQVGGATVVLYGPQGTGKTVLAVHAIREATEAGRRAKFCTATLLASELSDAKSAGRMAAELRAWVGVDVLVIDQFDKVGKADWENRLIFEILDNRHNAERVTILVVNANTDELPGILGASMVQRVQEAGAALNCDWARFRPVQ